MTRDEIEKKLAEIVRAEKPAIDPELIAPATPLAEAGIDSLDALTVLFTIEEQFGISIPDEKARGLKTFGDIVAAVEAQLNAAG
jgi:acyl carrier protein